MKPHHRPAALGLLIVLITTATGCNLGAFVMPRERTYQVEAQYEGLEDSSVAVLVSADEYILFRFPDAPFDTSRVVSQQIQSTVPGAKVADPRLIRQFQQANPYWTTRRYSDLVQELGVDRLVIVELSEYRTNEPGNAHLWRGVISGMVGVVEADGVDPDDFAYTAQTGAQFPEDESVGVIDSDAQTMQLGMLKLFGRNVARLFHDHEIQESI